MKNRLNYNPFLRIIVFLFVLFFIVVVSAIGMFYYVFSIPEPEGLSLASWPNTFTDNFSTWIEYENNTVSVEKIGIERLNEYGLWVQIIDETGQEIFSHNKPGTYPTEYSVAELMAIAVLFSTSPKWSEKTLEAVVQEMVTMPDGEKRLIVERTTEIYASPLNSLCISEKTKLVDADGKTISAHELQPGSTVKVILKDAFVEETPFYYPDVYEIRVINAN